MKKFLLGFAVCAASAFAGTMSGVVSDAHCGAKHADASKASAACVEKCVKGGADPVFVADDGKVLKIANPDTVKEHLGHKVSITGDVKDDTITVESVKMSD